MLAYVPVRFDLYRPLKAHLRWTLQCLVAFADRAGKCWPSVRKLAEVVDVGKSTVSRHLAALVRVGVISRTRNPGGVYTYTIDARFLPGGVRLSHDAAPLSYDAAPLSYDAASVSHDAAGLSHDRAAPVPPAATEENPQEDTIKKTGESQGKLKGSLGGKADLADKADDRELSQWQARLRSWERSRFWLGYWGPKPNEPGCWAPSAAQSPSGAA